MSNLGGTIFLAAFGLFWCGLTFFFDGALAWNLVRQLRASSYPTVMGTVTHSEVKVEFDSEGNSYDAEIHYRYVVDRHTHDAKTVRFDYMISGKDQAEALVSKYPLGQAVTVHYNPAAPQIAVLELGPDLSNFLAVLFLTPFNAIALAFVGGFWATLRSKQLGRPMAGVSQHNDGLTTTIRVYERSPTISALAAWGGAGFLATFGVMFGSWIMPMEYALSLGWSATLAATLVAWQSARKKYTEIRLDQMRGRVDIRDADGRTFSLARDDVQPVTYSPRTTNDSDGDKTTKFALELRYLDPENQKARVLVLPEQTSKSDAELFAKWLNGLLRLLHVGT